MNTRVGLPVRLKVCAALKWLAAQYPAALDALANFVIRGGDKSNERKIRIEAVRRLNAAGVLYHTLHGLVEEAHLRDRILELIHDAGPEAVVAYRELSRKWAPAAPAVPTAAEGQESSSVPPAPTDVCPVELGGKNDAPLVLGKEQEPLTHQQYCVVKALVKAYPNGLSLDTLESRSGYNDVRGILTRIRGKSLEWSQVIFFPGSRDAGGYRIVPSSSGKQKRKRD